MTKRTKVAIIIAWLAVALLFIAAVHAQGQGLTPPAFPPIPGAAPSSATPQPLADSGSNDAFTYTRSSEVGEVFEIVPTDGSDPFIVSENFLQLVMRNPQMGGRGTLSQLRAYPQMTEGIYRQSMESNYPDSSVTFDEDFEERVLLSDIENGPSAVIVQDPVAGPYVRVTLKTQAGTVRELSVARAVAERVLSNETQSEADMIRALGSFPFPLPDEARDQFDSLTKEEIHEIASRMPSLQRQEFIRMHHVLRRIEEAKAADGEGTTGLAEVPGGTTDRAEVTPTPEDEIQIPLARPEPSGKTPRASARVDLPEVEVDTSADVSVAEDKGGSPFGPIVFVSIVALLAVGVVIFRVVAAPPKN